MPDHAPGTARVDAGARAERLDRAVVQGVEVIREGRIEPFLSARPALSSTAIRWGGLAVEDYRIPACVIPAHEHLHDFVHVVLSGAVPYEVLTAGRCLHFRAEPGTTFVLPRGTADELRWSGPTHRIAVSVHRSLLASALEETADERDVELVESWNATDRHIAAVLVAMTTDLDEGSPTGRLYGESLANALAVYLLGRYAMRQRSAKPLKGGLPGNRLKRVLEYIAENLGDEGLGLSDLAALAGMSPHYFAELFKRSTGSPPHRFVLQRRIERAKELLLDRTLSVLEAGLRVGFPNPSHFSRTFHRYVGVTPSTFRSSQLRAS